MRIVTIASYDNATEAAMARNLLEREGIESELGDAAIGTLLGGYIAPAVGGVKILVREEDVQRARAVLDHASASVWAGEVFGGDGDPWICVRCKKRVSDDLTRCWSCGASPEGKPDPSFRSLAADESNGDTADDDHEEEAPRPSDGPTPDDVVHRAFGYAVVGFLLLPPVLHLVSLVQLVGLADRPGRLTTPGRRKLWWTLALDVVGVVFGFALSWFVFLR